MKKPSKKHRKMIKKKRLNNSQIMHKQNSKKNNKNKNNKPLKALKTFKLKILANRHQSLTQMK